VEEAPAESSMGTDETSKPEDTKADSVNDGDEISTDRQEEGVSVKAIEEEGRAESTEVEQDNQEMVVTEMEDEADDLAEDAKTNMDMDEENVIKDDTAVEQDQSKVENAERTTASSNVEDSSEKSGEEETAKSAEKESGVEITTEDGHEAMETESSILDHIEEASNQSAASSKKDETESTDFSLLKVKKEKTEEGTYILYLLIQATSFLM